MGHRQGSVHKAELQAEDESIVFGWSGKQASNTASTATQEDHSDFVTAPYIDTCKAFELIVYLHTPPRTPASRHSKRYHQVMPSSWVVVVFCDAASGSTALILASKSKSGFTGNAWYTLCTLVLSAPQLHSSLCARRLFFFFYGNVHILSVYKKNCSVIKGDLTEGSKLKF